MTSGEKMNRTSERPESTFRALKPTALDEVAEEAHFRRRDTELSRIMQAGAEPRATAWRARKRSLVLAGGMAATIAVAGGALALTGGAPGDPAGGASGGVSGGDGTTRTVPIPATAEARTVLLASAKTAETAPAAEGRYWYTRTRTQFLRNYTHERPDGTLGVLRPDEKKSGMQAKVKKLPYTYQLSSEQESWWAMSRKDRSRSISGIGTKVSFPTQKDEAAWRAAGSPNLVHPAERKRTVKDRASTSEQFIIGDSPASLEELRKLPVNAQSLDAELRRRYAVDTKGTNGKRETQPYPSYVWMVAQDLLVAPVTPGTKAALYRLLAEQPGVRSSGTVTDQPGRKGVAVERTEHGTTSRLVIDPLTADLLASESNESPVGNVGNTPGVALTYKAMGWVGSLNARP